MRSPRVKYRSFEDCGRESQVRDDKSNARETGGIGNAWRFVARDKRDKLITVEFDIARYEIRIRKFQISFLSAKQKCQECCGPAVTRAA